MSNNVVPSTDVRLILLDVLLNRLRRHVERNGSGTLPQRDPPAMLVWGDAETRADAIRRLVSRAREDDPPLSLSLRAVNGLVQRVLDADGPAQLAGVMTEIENTVLSWAPTTGPSVVSSSSGAHFTHNGSGPFTATVPAALDPATQRRQQEDRADLEFLAGVAQMLADRRRSGAYFTVADEAVMERAYQLVDRGVRPPVPYQSVRTDANRLYQTYLSFADPGDGHLDVTVRQRDLLAGLIVHIEYIDRDGVNDRARVEAYRLPALRNAARVRLHVGDVTPCTAFIGRPVFEADDFELGLLKAAHTTASVCSSMFSLGIADCKVAMDNMTASQCVRFMRAVVGNVVRDPLRQRLSAAFNLRTPLQDDRDRRTAGPVTDPFAIARLGIHLTRDGRFNKVAWDGASDQPPSRPIIGLLTRVQLFDLVHEAHQWGLETYISAGMRTSHMADAVFVGVGGVGIGTSLHFVDPRTNAIGKIDPELVLKALRVRDDAARTPAGQAAGALAQLDWAYLWAPSTNLRELRDNLYRAHREFLVGYEAEAMKLPENQAPPPLGVPSPVPLTEAQRDLVEKRMWELAAQASYHR